MYEKQWFFKPYSSFTSWTDTRMRRTFEPKIDFIKEVEILYFCLISLKPIFDYKLIIDYDLNLSLIILLIHI